MKLSQNHRIYLRQLLAKKIPPPSSNCKKIAVSGLPRSGTSWIAKCISLAKGVNYYFEPDHLLTKENWYKYIPENANEPFLQQYIQDSLDGKITEEYVIAEQGLKQLLSKPFASTILVKWVRFSLGLEWIAHNHPELAIVQTIRHPVPLFLSWRQRDWNPSFALVLLLEQPILKEKLKPYQTTIESVESFWEIAGVFWSIISMFQLQAHNKNKNSILKEHEWFCSDPDNNFHWLIEQLELKWTSDIDEFLSPNRKKIAGPGYGKRRDPKDEIHKWQSKISNSELSELENVVKQFNLPFYENLDPEKFW